MLQHNYITPFFILRTPLLPISFIEKTDFSYGGDINKIVDSLSDTFLEALYLASPPLYNELMRIKKDDVKLSRDKHEKLLISLFKYINRASNRCTPFGLFSSCSIGTISDAKDLNIDKQKYIKHLRLDMDILCRLSKKISLLPSIRLNLKYRSNSSIYKANGSLKYFEYKYSPNGHRTFHLSGTENNQIILKIISFCRDHKSIDQIIEYVLSLHDFDKEEVVVYINDLIDNSILLSNIEPNVTGNEFFYILKDIIGKIKPSTDEIRNLQQLILNIDQKLQLSRDSIDPIEHYLTIHRLIKSFLETDDLTKDSVLFQVDTIEKNENLSLPHDLVNSIIDNIQIVNNFTKHETYESQYLKSFKRAFYEKYDKQAVRLVDVFDKENGLGYRDLHHDTRHFSEKNIQNNLSEIEKLAFKHYKQYLINENKEIVLTKDDFQSHRMNPLPDNFSLMGNLHGEKFNIISLPISTTNLIGRFCHADQDLENLVKDKLSPHEQEGTIYAEIAHLPESRIGNVLSRPHLLDWEIEFLANSSINLEKRISITDLYICMEKNEVILFSKRHNKRVIPRLSSAHNFTNKSLEIYHFLCEIQNQNSPMINLWKWPRLLMEETFLPRVTYENLILSSARWLITQEEITNQQKELNLDFKDSFILLMEKYCISNVFLLKKHDNFLVINTDIEICFNVLEKEFKKNRTVELTEYVFDSLGTEILDDGNNIYTNEIIIPVLKRKDTNEVPLNMPKAVSAKRDYLLGEDWLYVKVYCRTKISNQVLTKIYSKVKNYLKADETFFFIRYNDPLPHIRIRFQSKNRQFEFLSILSGALKYFIKNNKIDNIMTDKYVREIERYESQDIDLSEKIFHLNSIIVLEYLKHNESIDPYVFAFTVIESTLDAMQLRKDEKFEIYRTGFNNFAHEFSFKKNKIVQNHLKNLFKEKLNSLQTCDSHSAITSYQKNLAILLDGKSNNYNSSFVLSHIHMFINRLFNQNQRFEELAIFYITEKYYLFRKNTI